MKWQHKYMIQKALSIIPGGMGVNELLSRRCGGKKDPKFYAIANTLAIYSLIRRHGFEIAEPTCVELGTGWNASAPMVLLSLGAESVHSFDLFRHLDERLMALARAELDHLERHTSKEPFPFECDLAAIAAECRVDAIDMSRLHYYAPHDARETGLESDFADLYLSSGVLEHVGEEVMPDILRESHRLLKSGGLCCHYAQPFMHAERTDPNATVVDHLCCSDRRWRWLYDNDIAHENRLRGVQYVELLRAAGFEIVGSWNTLDSKALAALPGMKLAPRFQRFSPEELAADHIWVLGRKA